MRRFWKRKTTAEVEASKFDLRISPERQHPGSGQRAGLAMATMDTIKLFGAEPATFSMSARSYEQR